MSRRDRLLSCIGIVVALTVGLPLANAAEPERARLAVATMAIDGRPRLLVSVVNLSSADLLVARRFLLRGGPAAIGELWLDVRDDRGAEVNFRCSIRAARLRVGQLTPLAPMQSVGRLIDLDLCYTLQPGKVYRITAHVQLSPGDPERLPKGKSALLEPLTADPVEVRVPPAP